MKQKYPDLNQLRVLMSLTYFDNAENGLDPVMLKQVEWESVKKFLISEVSDFR